MKRVALVGLSMLLSSSLSFAQDAPAAKSADTAPSTKLGAFLGKRGTLLVRDFYQVGILSQKKDFNNADYKASKFYTSYEQMNKDRSETFVSNDATVDVTALAVYEPGNEKVKVKGLQIILYKYNRSGSDKNLSFVDVEEARSLSKALDYLVDAAAKSKGQDVGSREVSFTTKDNLKVVLSQSGAKDAEVQMSSGTIGRATVSLASVDDLTQIKSAVDNGVAWLEKQ